MGSPLPPETRYARLTPDGVKYANDSDRQEAYARAVARVRAAAARETLRLESGEVNDLPALLGGRSARPTQNLVVYFPGGQKVIQMAPQGRLEAAAIQETLLRKLEEGVAPPRIMKKPNPATQLVIAQALGKTKNGRLVRP